jgi:hypothetical protein
MIWVEMVWLWELDQRIRFPDDLLGTRIFGDMWAALLLFFDGTIQEHGYLLLATPEGEARALRDVNLWRNGERHPGRFSS